MSEKNSKLAFFIFFAVFVFSIVLIVLTFSKNINLISKVNNKTGLDLLMEKIYEDDDFLAYLERKKEDGSYYTNNKLNDTDGDGLSDFDEENIFFTSKYLFDSDGDGVSDLEEIRSGIDPNCPVGSSCGVYNTETSTNDLDYSVDEVRSLFNKLVGNDYSEIFDSLTDDQIMNLFNNSYNKTQELFSSISGSLENLDVEEFLNKKEIKETDSENIINKNNDNDNVDLFLEAISDLSNEQIQSISSMEIFEIRNLFIDSGIFTKDFMDSFTDSELLELLNVL